MPGDEWKDYTGLEHAPRPAYLRKQEAMALLALDELTRGQEIELNILTAKQAGYTIRKTGWMRQPAWSEAYPTYQLVSPMGNDIEDAVSLDNVWLNAPEFCTSVDACLTLPVSVAWHWRLSTANTIINAELYDLGGERWAKEFGDTLPLAMLKTWWQIQPD